MAPIVLFAYNRLDALVRTVTALQKNTLAGESDLFVFSDGPKRETDEQAVAGVRRYLRTIGGFKNVHLTEAPVNRGLAKSVINGVSEVIGRHGSVIVLEDDIVTAPNFLSFMNAALDFYGGAPSVYSISGYSLPILADKGSDVYFTLRSFSWGWATWADRWQGVDWDVSGYDTFRSDRRQRHRFNQMGSDLAKMLDDQMKGKINSWAIRWVFNQFLQQKYTVFPVVSKAENIGFAEGATHTKKGLNNRFRTSLDDTGKTAFTFPPEPALDPEILGQFTHYFSVPVRLRFKIKQIIASI